MIFKKSLVLLVVTSGTWVLFLKQNELHTKCIQMKWQGPGRHVRQEPLGQGCRWGGRGGERPTTHPADTGGGCGRGACHYLLAVSASI